MSRRRRIGDLGEHWTKSLLERAGFVDVRDLNRVRYNHAGGDFIAERGGKRYFITVKARNKYRQGTRKLNGGYNIHPEKVRRAAREYDAEPAWLTIQLDTEERTYSAYFGTVSSLGNPDAVAVPMLPRNVTGYECLAVNVVDEAITPDLSNQLTSEEHVKPPVRQPRQTPPAKAASPAASFEDHIAYAEPSVRPILHELRRRITRLGSGIKENVTPAQRVTYRLTHDFVEIKVQKKRVLVRLFDTGVPDPRSIATPIPKSNGWSHDAELAINTVDLVDYAMPFITASYRRELSR
jgi:predicted transport protein